MEERIGSAPIYPNTSINGISHGYIPTTNAIKVNGCTVGTLVDTGACFTFLDIRAFPSDMEFLNPRPYTANAILSASEDPVPTIMIVDAYFVLGSIILKHPVLLTEKLPHDCIIGMDWLKRMKKFTMIYKDPIMCKIDYEGVTELFWLNVATEKEGRLYLDNDYELKPRTINLITTNVEDNFRFKHSLCLIESLNNPPAGIEIVSQCVTRPRFIVARNLKETTVNLKKGTPIGVIYAIPESKRGVACLNTMYPGEKTYPDPDVFKDQIRSPYYNLLREYGDVVAHEGYDLGQTHSDTRNSSVRRRTDQTEMKEELDRQIEDMRRTGVIRPSTSP